MKKNLLKNSAVQTLVASLICIVLGLFLGYLVLLLINPVGAGDAILTVIKNFWTYNRQASQVKYLGNTLVKTAPLRYRNVFSGEKLPQGIFCAKTAGSNVEGIVPPSYLFNGT